MISTDISNIYLGDYGATAAYLDGEKIWPQYQRVAAVCGDLTSGVTSRITFEFNTSADLKWEFKGQFLKTSSAVHFGANYPQDRWDYRVFVSTRGATYFDLGESRINRSSQLYINTDYVLTCGNYYVIEGEDNVILSGTTKTEEEVPNTMPFQIHAAYLKTRELKAWYGDTLILSAYPAYSPADDAYGLYDEVTHKFYYPESRCLTACE